MQMTSQLSRIELGRDPDIDPLDCLVMTTVFVICQQQLCLSWDLFDGKQLSPAGHLNQMDWNIASMRMGLNWIRAASLSLLQIKGSRSRTEVLTPPVKKLLQNCSVVQRRKENRSASCSRRL